MHVCARGDIWDFCKASACDPYPITEDGLRRFVPYLADSNLKHQTIKLYLSATRFGQIMAGFGDPFVLSMPILEYLLRGIKYNQVKRCPIDKRSKMPITPEILARIHAVLAESAQDPDSIML